LSYRLLARLGRSISNRLSFGWGWVPSQYSVICVCF
jgi:hypothetical protein